jgi:hypothetical protein
MSSLASAVAARAPVAPRVTSAPSSSRSAIRASRGVRVGGARVRRTAARAAAEDDAEAEDDSTRNSESGLFMRRITPEEEEAEVKYLAGMIKLWLDDEWSLQEPHAELGLQAARKVTAMRLEGCEEMGAIIMGVTQDLLTFDFSDTFVNAFEVANKCGEILMMREGFEVCCLNSDDETRAARYEEMVARGEA